MKKVFHIVSHFDIGGAERVAVNIAKSPTAGYEYHVVELIRARSQFSREYKRMFGESPLKDTHKKRIELC